MRMFMFVFHDGIDFTRSTTPKYFDLLIMKKFRTGLHFLVFYSFVYIFSNVSNLCLRFNVFFLP